MWRRSGERRSEQLPLACDGFVMDLLCTVRARLRWVTDIGLQAKKKQQLIEAHLSEQVLTEGLA